MLFTKKEILKKNNTHTHTKLMLNVESENSGL